MYLLRKTKKGIVIKESDHNVLITEFNTSFISNNKNNKLELYNIKNTDCQEKFKAYTSNTNMLSSVFDSEEDLNILTKRFIKKIDGCIKHSFRKVRVSNNKPSDEEKLYDNMRKLKGKEDEQSVQKLNEVINAIAVHAEIKYNKVVKELEEIKPEGRKINSQKFWKLKRKVCPKIWDPPTAMMDREGNLITNKNAIDDRAI